MSEWSAFYSITAAASATLLGLLFVAVSVAAPSALNDGHSPVRHLAEQSFQNYLLVLVLSCFALFPHASLVVASRVILFATASRAIWALFRLWTIARYTATWRARLKAVRRQIASLAGLACLLVAALKMASESTQMLGLLAGGTLVLLTSSVVASWELLLQIVKGRTASAASGG